MVKNIVILVCCSISLCLYMSAESEFEKFARKFAPPKDMQETIEQNKDSLKPLEGKRIGNVFYKGVALIVGHLEAAKCLGFCRHTAGFSRIVNAYRMDQCIKRHNLSLLALPKKYIYFVNDRWCVVTEKLQPDEHATKELSDDQIKQLTTLVEETGFEDFGCPLGGGAGHLGRNIIMQDGKLYFIDTENLSFMDSKAQKLVFPFWHDKSITYYKDKIYISGAIHHNCKAQYVENLYYHLHIDKKFFGSKQIYHWLRDRLDYLMHSTEGLTEKKPIHQSTEFDEGDINFKKAQQELKNIEYHTSYRRTFDRDCVQSGNTSLLNDVNWCKKLMASMAAIDKKLQEKYGAQPRADMQDPKRQEAAARWQSA